MNAAVMTRFSVKQRIEHIAIMTLFTVLCVTGFPQKFFEAGWSRTMVVAMGGIVTVRWIHRISGILFSVLVTLHLATALLQVFRRKVALMSIVPNKKDFIDAIQMLRYYLGLSREHAHFDRFDYRQKFEYWGLVLGSVVMVVTGYILFYPTAVALLLPGELIPASKVAHSNEGLMAFLVVIVWHIYNAHLNPDVFPFDTSIFTGKISRERMEKEHPIELARIEGKGPEGTGGSG